ncbi:hypothetical protein JW766_02370 [Candidatus Dojkabacteria bacterium]|nr:hypothetical protein [Candidatus Dojkabacteria bacterium]
MEKLIPLLFIASFILAGYTIFPTMSLLLIIWFGLFFLARHRKLDRKLNKKEAKFYYIVIFTYPLLEGIIKLLIVQNIIPGSWFWLNRVEHFLSAIAIEALFYPLLKPTILKLNQKEAFIFVVSTVVLIGNFNEFFEYAIRLQLKLTDAARFSAYYWDTIYDMAINILGASTGFLLLWKFSRVKPKTARNYNQKRFPEIIS